MCCNKTEFAFYGEQKSRRKYFVVDMTKQKINMSFAIPIPL